MGIFIRGVEVGGRIESAIGLLSDYVYKLRTKMN